MVAAMTTIVDVSDKQCQISMLSDNCIKQGCSQSQSVFTSPYYYDHVYMHGTAGQGVPAAAGTAAIGGGRTGSTGAEAASLGVRIGSTAIWNRIEPPLRTVNPACHEGLV